ncbi:MAG TPA: nitroreductase/quinone reductase family protein [Ilumatobacteraceae bacterium]|nr:nitroreductase/quinone reductase family protein [Ilumatobacteraceae bacterium]
MTSWLAEHADDDCCDVRTTGRRTGEPHEIEIWFGVIDDTMYLISGNGPDADWYRNALVDSHVTVRLNGETHDGVARDVSDADERRRVGDVMGAKYPWDGDASIGLTRQAWCYDVPVLAIGQWDR